MTHPREDRCAPAQEQDIALHPSSGHIGEYPTLTEEQAAELLQCLAALKPLLVCWLVSQGFDGDVAEQAVEDAMWIARSWVLTGKVVTLGDRRRRWLKVVSRNAAITLARRKPFLRPVEHAESRPPRRVSERSEEVRITLREAVARAILRLRERDRDVLLACEVEGMSYREAAEMFMVHTSTINRLLARARRRLYDAVLEEARAEGYDLADLPTFCH